MNVTKQALVVTSISGPNVALRALAAGAAGAGWHFVVIGDVPSPADFELKGCDFYGLERQLATGLSYAQACPTRHYARKNIGYLLAIARGVDVIVDTDDDNLPRPAFWAERARVQSMPQVAADGWVNVYRYFTDISVWPRGLPLDAVRAEWPAFESLPTRRVDAPIQQGLADDNPDVDAVYRLLLPLPVTFRTDRQVALASGTWSPFNSQNTVWWRDAFPLLYLPAHCSFRMTDIWRSFVAQRIAWENDWRVVFFGPTVCQERNEHDLMRDFRDEVPGYLNNRRICDELAKLDLAGGVEAIPENLRACYERLVAIDVMGRDELPLLECWLADLAAAR